ncbi:hypothetical protein F5972_11040 [Microbispora cellulosiformans]|uniref:Uncharacterized protein n=1 Tax=Microbispora cellulosiformans TaxID=2614688 RepID=A0A5J5K7H7_9ACTN|nr:hypothetical protein [Microbispora cellulosiformans]KAA9380130.1 hypothetical protein F5972_11040 [Microbispora cellulosiformans]
MRFTVGLHVFVVLADTRNEIQDGLTVVVGKNGERVKWGRFGIVRAGTPSVGRLPSGDNRLAGLLPHPRVKTVEAPFSRRGAGQHGDLVRGEHFAERGEPTLLEVLLANDDEVDERRQDAVVKVLELVENGASLPEGTVEVGDAIQEFDEPRGARRGPSRRPGRAMVPKLEDSRASVGGPGGGVRFPGRFGLFGGVDESSGVVGEPSGESVVRSSFAEVFEDLLAKADDGVLICQ